MKHYLAVWWLQVTQTSQSALVSRLGAVLFVLGKILRFFSFLFFLFVISQRVQVTLGYNFWQMMFFFLTFNLIDTSAQLLLREVYRFRGLIVSGDFDLFLIKPYPLLIRCLFGGSDILDLPLLAVIIASLIFVSYHLPHLSYISLTFFILLVINGLSIAIAFHIIILSLGIFSTAIDNALFLYRDLTQMGRVPTDIYKEPLRSILMFAIPVGIMITLPAKVFMGFFSPSVVIFAFILNGLFLFLSLRLWNYALRFYASASS